MKPGSMGFTLIELLLVIAVIGVISTVAVTKLGNVEQQSRVAVSLSNMSDVHRAIETYFVRKKGKYPDGWDSLLDLADTTQVYQGNGDPLVNAGVSTSWLVVRPITSSELGSMKRVSPTAISPGGASNTFVTVYDHDSAATVIDANQSTNASAARLLGSSTVTDLNCAFVDPTTTAGARIVTDFHQDLDTNDDGTNEYSLLALGLGPRNTMIGDTQAGLAEAPVAHEVAPNADKAYRRFICLFKVASGPVGLYFAEFVGVVTVYGRTQGGLRAFLQ